MELAAGLRAKIVTVVSGADTAERMGSGDVPVLGTPRLLALAEEATVAAVAEGLPPGHTSVGTVVRLEHLAASPVGMEVAVTAELTEVDGRRLAFRVSATDGDRLGPDRARRRGPGNVPVPLARLTRLPPGGRRRRPWPADVDVQAAVHPLVSEGRWKILAYLESSCYFPIRQVVSR